MGPLLPCVNVIAVPARREVDDMRKVVIGTIGAVTLLVGGMLAGNSEAARLTGCCHIAGRSVLRNGLLGYRSWASASEMLQTIW